MNHAHLNNDRCLVYDLDRLVLLRNDSATIFCTDRDVFVHKFIFLVKQALLIILDVVCLQEKVELFFLNLFGKTFSMLLVSRLKELQLVLIALDYALTHCLSNHLTLPIVHVILMLLLLLVYGGCSLR